jgi:hypothetical protein
MQEKKRKSVKKCEKVRGKRESGAMLQMGSRAFKCSYCKEIACEGGRKGRREGIERWCVLVLQLKRVVQIKISVYSIMKYSQEK